MHNVRDYRVQYSRSSDVDLLSLLTAGPETMAPEAWSALLDEVRHRHLPTASAPPGTIAPLAMGIGSRRYAKAPLGSRLLARIIDGVVGFVPMFGAILLMVLNKGRSGAFSNVIILLASIAWCLYYEFAKDGFARGQSFGKKQLNLMVVNVTTNRPCSVGESVIRALIMALLNLVPLVGWLIEPITVIVAEDGRRLGDRAAGTQVIDARAYDGTAI